MNLDNQARAAYKQSPSSAVYFVVLASYLYYVRFESVLSDDVFDKMTKLILDKNIKHSKLSHLITDDDLRAGSLFRLRATDYPYFITEQAEKILRGVNTYVIQELEPQC